MTDSGATSALSHLPFVFLGNSPESAKRYAVREAAWMPRGWKLALEGVDTFEQAEALRGMTLYAESAELPKPEENEYYIAELVGAEAVDTATGAVIGHLEGIEPTGATDRWWFRGTDGSEIVVPAIRRYVERVDREARRIYLANLAELVIE